MGSYWVEIADQHHTGKQIEFLKTRIEEDKCILDVACGSGRHITVLSKSGYCIIGIDISANLLKIAKQRGAQHLVMGDMRFLPFKSDVFNAAISMDTSFGYIQSKKNDQLSITEVRRVLSIEGEFVLDVFNREKLATKYQGKNPLKYLREYPSFYLEQERTVNKSKTKLCDIWTIRDKTTGQSKRFIHSVRLYRYPELEALLLGAGFTVNSFFGDYEGQEYRVNSPRLIIIALKK
jgi:ubiquinone/menaquinone biosynthesis C-methylase UbiE